jgi:murein L,D-transpeptidase YafK
VEKSKYRLTVLYQNRPVKHYPIVLGTNPRDDKRFEGDACTPEGEFRITARRPHRSWTHFLLLNYPTSASYRKHNAAKRRGLIPRNATVGSAIGIHGVPKGGDDWIDRRENWTLGCVSLKTAAIREIYATTQNGTKVRIKP